MMVRRQAFEGGGFSVSVPNIRVPEEVKQAVSTAQQAVSTAQQAAKPPVPRPPSPPISPVEEQSKPIGETLKQYAVPIGAVAVVGALAVFLILKNKKRST